MVRRWNGMSLETLQSLVVSLLGDNVLGIIVFGSASRLEDFSPMSDVNVAIITKSRVSLEERILIAEELGHDVSTLILTLEELRKLAEEGEYLAHEILAGGKIVYADESLYESVSTPPPITGRTLEYLEKNALACLNLSLENYFLGRLHDALNYAYKALRSVARLLGAREGRMCFWDREVLEVLNQHGLGGISDVYAKLRRGRLVGVGRGELLKTLLEAYASVLKLLGYGDVDLEKVITHVESNYAHVSRVKIDPQGERLVVYITGVDSRGEEKSSEIGLSR